MGGWWRWALVSPDGVALSRMVSMSVSVNLPLHQKIQQFSSGTGSPGWSQKEGRKTVVVVFYVKITSNQNGQKTPISHSFMAVTKNTEHLQH